MVKKAGDKQAISILTPTFALFVPALNGTGYFVFSDLKERPNPSKAWAADENRRSDSN